jgi:hypothetical protein
MSTNTEARQLTARELIECLQNMSPNTTIYFEGLTFHKLKHRGPEILQIEFNEQPDGETETHKMFQKYPI